MIANDYYFDEFSDFDQKQFVMANDQYNLGLESGYEVLNESLYDIIIKIMMKRKEEYI